jgi:hypothetical protein
MARFVECDKGLVNLDHVVTIGELTNDNRRRLLFFGTDNKVLGQQSPAVEYLDEFTGTIVPAAAGASAYVMWPWPDSAGERPTHIEVDHVPIVAWRVHWGVGIPVLVEMVPTGATVYIVMPDGKLCAQDSHGYDDLAAAQRGRLAYAQAAWDANHTKAEP